MGTLAYRKLPGELVSAAVMRHYDQKQLGKGRARVVLVYEGSHLSSYLEGKAREEHGGSK